MCIRDSRLSLMWRKPQTRGDSDRGPRPSWRKTVTAQHRRAPSRETVRRHRLIVRGLLVGLVAGIGFGSWWFIAAADTPSTPTAQKQSAKPAATSPTPSPPPRPTTAAMAPLTLTASGPGRLTSGSRPSALPGPILIADEHNYRLMIIDPRGRTMWQFPRPGELAPGPTFKTVSYTH